MSQQVGVYDIVEALGGVESATDELNEELHRLTVNMKKLTEYQSLLLRVNSQLCSMMSNIGEMAKHRKQCRLQNATTS